MRKFSSYGPLDKDLHYYADREESIAGTLKQLIGEHEEGGHYITVWAPRQSGKSWIMQQVLFRLRQDSRFDVVKVNLDTLKAQDDVGQILAYISEKVSGRLGKIPVRTTTVEQFENLFTHDVLEKPLILILDEFDALGEGAIGKIAGVFRNIYLSRQDDPNSEIEAKEFLLHGVALIGVRSVLGIENERGSPFNVQRSVHIPNLSYEEVEGLFRWHERESSQTVHQDVIQRVYTETNGQPGLTCWIGEILTEGHDYYQPDREQPITMEVFENVYKAAVYSLPNNNILNIISKANKEPYQSLVLDLFKTGKTMTFRYDNKRINFLYQNGVIDQALDEASEPSIKFACPFVQKRLFNYFSYELFEYMGKLHEPFEDLSDVYTQAGLDIRGLALRFQTHIRNNREWLLEDAPRRKDLRIFEAVFHFSFYRFLCDFLGTKHAGVYPEFPTGNGQIDLLIVFDGQRYGIELKSFTNERDYADALEQAARYAQRLQLSEISLISFVESIGDDARRRYEIDHVNTEKGVTVFPIFVETGM